MFKAIIFDFFDVILTDTQKGAGIDTEVIALVEKLQGRYKIGLLTNTSSSFLRGLLKEHDIEKHFDTITVSSEVGMVKPSPEIFHHILSVMDVQPEEALFIDDNARNVAGGEEAGIKGIVYTDIKALQRDLKSLGIF